RGSNGPEFPIGDVITAEGKTRYTDLIVDDQSIVVCLPSKLRQGAGNGYWGDTPVRFSDRPQDAPIVHFGGPLTMDLFEFDGLKNKSVLVGRYGAKLFAVIGTPGLGKGTFAVVDGDWEPGVCPVADVEFRNKDSDEKISSRVRLNDHPGGPRGG